MAKLVAGVSERILRCAKAEFLDKGYTDASLRAIAAAILGRIRDSDTLIRYGGDEFLLIFPQIDEDVFYRRLSQLRDAVSRVVLDDVPELKESLTDREREVAELAARGMRNSEIAETLHISENTVKHHLKNAFQKMNIDRRSHLIEMLR